MAKVLPVLLAFVFSLSSQIFVTFCQIDGLRSGYAVYVIRVALYFLLLESSMYINGLRKIHSIPENILQFILGVFVIETTIVYIWYPLENTVFCLLSWLQRYLQPYWCFNLNEMFYYASFFFSVFLLSCILHATRSVDFKILRICGPYDFFQDIMCRLKKGLRNILRIKIKRSSIHRRTCRKRSSCK